MNNKIMIKPIDSSACVLCVNYTFIRVTSLNTPYHDVRVLKNSLIFLVLVPSDEPFHSPTPSGSISIEIFLHKYIIYQFLYIPQSKNPDI